MKHLGQLSWIFTKSSLGLDCQDRAGLYTGGGQQPELVAKSVSYACECRRVREGIKKEVSV